MNSPEFPLVVVPPQQPLISLSDDAGRRLAERGLAMLRHYQSFADFGHADLIVDSPVLRLRRLVSRGESDEAFDLALEIGKGEDAVAATEALGVMLRIARSDDGHYAWQVAVWYNIGIPPFGRNWPYSAKWATLSASKGYANGEAYLAWLYSMGRGVAHDHAAVIHHALSAIEKGNAFALGLVALDYYRGTGVVQDLPRSHAYLALLRDLPRSSMSEEQKHALKELDQSLDQSSLDRSREIQRKFIDLHRLTTPWEYESQ